MPGRKTTGLNDLTNYLIRNTLVLKWINDAVVSARYIAWISYDALS
jgi:hypothetical protein